MKPSHSLQHICSDCLAVNTALSALLAHLFVKREDEAFTFASERMFAIAIGGCQALAHLFAFAKDGCLAHPF